MLPSEFHVATLPGSHCDDSARAWFGHRAGPIIELTTRFGVSYVWICDDKGWTVVRDDQQMRILRAIPVLEVANVEASIDWYRAILGFTADPFPQTPPFQFAILRHGDTELMLQCGTSKAPHEPQPYRWNVYLRLAGGELRELFTRLSDRSIVSRRLERMFYGLAEFEITDPDGYVVCLSEELEDSRDLPTPVV